MHTVAIIADKGGVGKTTLALSLAAISSARGKLTAVLDIDPGQRAMIWKDRRALDTPWVVSLQSARLVTGIEQAVKAGVEMTVIDTPGNYEMSQATEAARQSNLAVVVVEPHVYSLESVARIGEMMRLIGTPAVFAVNRARVGTNGARVTTEFLNKLGVKVCPAVLYLREAHGQASNIGKIATEFAANSKAAVEIEQFYEFVLTTLKRKGPNGKVV